MSISKARDLIYNNNLSGLYELWENEYSKELDDYVYYTLSKALKLGKDEDMESTNPYILLNIYDKVGHSELFNMVKYLTKFSICDYSIDNPQDNHLTRIYFDDGYFPFNLGGFGEISLNQLVITPDKTFMKMWLDVEIDDYYWDEDGEGGDVLTEVEVSFAWEPGEEVKVIGGSNTFITAKGVRGIADDLYKSLTS